MTGKDMRRSETEHLTALLNQAADTSGMTERFTYGTDPSQFVEVYGSPDNATRAVVFIHGGYFRDSIDLSHARPMARALALQGTVVGLLEYRRAKGTGGHPQTLEDVTAGISAFNARLAPELDLVVSGHSAGGCLALSWASHLAAGGPPVRVRALAPVTDLVVEANQKLADGAVLDYMGCTPDDDVAAYLHEDPRSRAACIPSRVNVLLVHGSADETVDIEFSRNYPAPRVELEGADHFDVIDPASSYFPEVLGTLW